MANDVKGRESPQTASQSSGNESKTGQSGSEANALKGSGQQSAQHQGGAMQQHRGGAATRHARHPIAMMQQLSDEVDRLFESLSFGFPGRAGATGSGAPSLWLPEIDISMQGNQLRVCVDLPGIPKDSVKIDVNDGMLTIHGERREERNEGSEQQGFHRTERRYGSFYRSIALPEGASIDQAKAQMKDGVLEITVPMLEQQSKWKSLPIEG